MLNRYQQRILQILHKHAACDVPEIQTHLLSMDNSGVARSDFVAAMCWLVHNGYICGAATVFESIHFENTDSRVFALTEKGRDIYAACTE